MTEITKSTEAKKDEMQVEKEKLESVKRADAAVKTMHDFTSPEVLYKELINKDWFMTLLDLKEYIARKEQVLNDYADRKKWAKKMLINIAKAGFFSSDRTIAQYDEEIWKL